MRANSSPREAPSLVPASITKAALDRLLAGARPQGLRKATRLAAEARVDDLQGSGNEVTTCLRDSDRDYVVTLRQAGAGFRSQCDCDDTWDPCVHGLATALVLRQCLTKSDERPASRRPVVRDEALDDARRAAMDERRLAAKRERLRVALDPEAPFVRVSSASGFAYRVQLRGGIRGPHSCDCPDFEANRLHSCKHVERVRMNLAGGRKLAAGHRRSAARPRVYLHFGERIEPRLFGSPQGAGSRALKSSFDAEGRPSWTDGEDLSRTRARLHALGEWVEPEALAWIEERAARRPELPATDAASLLPPTALKPYPYQVEGALFLARAGRGLLADEMGLGKTAQAILAAAALRKAKIPVRSVTVVCPASLRGGWQEEIRRWLGEQAVLLEGAAHERARTIAVRPPWLITHYEQVLRDHEGHRASPPDLLVIDEAQRVKGLAGRTARVVKAIGAPHVFALTGTPLENRLEEAYSIAQLVDQRLLPPLWQLERDHFVRDAQGRRVVEYKGLDLLRGRLQGSFLRRRKEDVALDLPDRVRSVSFVPLHDAVKATYEDVMSQVGRILHKPVLLPADLDRMLRLLVIARRACNGPHMLGIDVDDAKVPKIAELRAVLDDLCLGEGRKVVIFSEWTDMTDRVEALCRRMKLPAFHLHGGVPIRRRPALIQSFRDSAGAAVFISTDAGGVGLNLQVADAVVNLDLPWNPAKLEQRIARVHRIGSRRTVNEILLVARHSVEHRILLLHDMKRNALANVWAKDGDDVIAAPGGSGLFRDMVEALCATEAPAELAASPAQVAEPIEAAAARDAPADARASSPAAVSGAAVHAESLARAVAAVAPAIPAEHRASLAAVFRSIAGALEGLEP